MTEHTALPGHTPDLPQLSAYLDGELDARACARTEQHLRTCPLCARQLDELRRLSHGIRALPPATLGLDLAGVIEHRLAAAAPRPSRPADARNAWPSRWPLALGGAAALVLGLVLGSVLMGGGAAVASGPRLASLRVLDAAPPGNLCIGFQACFNQGQLP